MELNERAKKLVGNWKKFDSFMWSNEPENNSQNWAIVYTDNRDSTLLDQSNAAEIAKILKPFIGDNLQSESHNHWACGYVNGYSIKVYDDNGNITDAFKAYHEIRERLENYPVLNEDDYYTRESEATFENIKIALHDNGYTLTDDQASKVYAWFGDNNQSAIDSKDDSGGWPDDDEIETACKALGINKD